MFLQCQIAYKRQPLLIKNRRGLRYDVLLMARLLVHIYSIATRYSEPNWLVCSLAF